MYGKVNTISESCGIWLKHGVPKAINWSKIYKVKQNYYESSIDFLNRLKETAIKYTDFDSESMDSKAHL